MRSSRLRIIFTTKISFRSSIDSSSRINKFKFLTKKQCCISRIVSELVDHCNEDNLTHLLHFNALRYNPDLSWT